MDYKKSLVLFYVGFAVLVLFAVIWNLSKRDIFAWIGIAVAAAGLIQTAVFYKCPHCGKGFNLRGGLMDYCPHCGEKLE